MAKNQGPWGNNDNSSPWGDSEETLSNPKVVDFSVLERVKNDDGFDFKFGWAVAIIVALWLASGFYQIQPSDQGVVLRFGAYAYTTDAGLHYHLPYPIEKVEKVNITRERSINIGEVETYRNAANSFTESHMLTGDENIVDINLTVVWKIKNAKDYLFNMRSPDVTVRVAAQSVLREIVGQSQMQPIITGDRGKVEDEAAQRLQNAQAYKEAVVNKAKGEAERFISVYNAYKQGKDVTAKRLYLETMEEVLNKSNKVILDQSGKGNAILPLLPINQNNVASTAVNNKN